MPHPQYEYGVGGGMNSGPSPDSRSVTLTAASVPKTHHFLDRDHRKLAVEPFAANLGLDDRIGENGRWRVLGEQVGGAHLGEEQPGDEIAVVRLEPVSDDAIAQSCGHLVEIAVFERNLVCDEGEGLLQAVARRLVDLYRPNSRSSGFLARISPSSPWPVPP